jgi:hypothetical protein
MRTPLYCATALAALSMLAFTTPTGAQPGPAPSQRSETIVLENTTAEAVEWTWSGHRVNQDFVIRPGHQVLAFYDANRQLTVAHRTSTERGTLPWRFQKLPTWVAWDSHNYPAIGIDQDGHIHVMANMHVDQMVYFRTTRPWDVRSLVGYDHVVNPAEEGRVTYPVFLNDAEGALIAMYRSGSSGDGVQIFNRYDVAAKKWSRLHASPLVDGEGLRNAYFVGPVQGPDGYFHMVWVWRETPSADTNHDLTYARSRDLITWETSSGKKLALPMKLGDAEIVDPVQPGGGLLNGQTKLGFTRDNAPMISYYKRDRAGDHQIFLAVLRNGRWRSAQITNWQGLRLELDRGGSLSLPLSIAADPYVAADGELRVRVIKDGAPTEIRVNASTLRPIAETPYEQYPAAVAQRPRPPGSVLQVESATDDYGATWFMSWHALPSNQDRARADIPPPSTLMLHRFSSAPAK